MGKNGIATAALLGGIALATVAGAHDDSFWVSARTRGLDDDADMLLASNIIVRAAQAGMRNVLWPGDIDRYWLWSDSRKARFLEVKRIADANNMRIVPSIWSTGYGTMVSVDPGLIESRPLKDLPYVAKGGRLVPDKSEEQLAPGGGFEGFATFADVAAAGWQTNRMFAPAAIDTGVFRSGGASLRVEQGDDIKKDAARVHRHIALRPGRLYRASVWYKAENLPKASGHLRLKVLVDGVEKPMEKTLNHYDSAKDTRWRNLTIDFPSGSSTGALIMCGSWKAKTGTFWIDDISVEETGLREIAQRADSPRTVRSAATGKVYEQGKDWRNPNFRKIKSGEEITFPLPEGSAIKEGEKVKIDTYVPSHAGPKMQISTCMSDPKLYELFRKSAEVLEELLHPDRWYLSLDEVRNGGTCPLCAARKTDMAHIFADCIIKQHEIIRSVHPGADIYMPSDMVDPHHNAKPGPYYGCNGTFYGVWDLIPRDIVISLWHGGVIDKSVPFFTERGFRVMGSISVDSDRLAEKLKKWKDAFNAHPGAMGFRYTTWTMNYDRLSEFIESLR